MRFFFGFLFLIFWLVSHGATAEHLTFLTVGDWGGLSLGGTEADNALATAKGMGEIAAQNGVDFIINVGDNFYDYGVNDTKDPLWESDWKNLFNAPSLQVPWYSVLGNHDYAGNPAIQVNYPYSPLWVMPARSYVQRILNPSASENVTFIFWDSNPCVSAWRGDNPDDWKPSTPAFHANIIAEDCTANVGWLTRELDSAVDRWVIVVTHVATFEIDMIDVSKLFDNYGVSVALVGHKHRLSWYKVKHTDVDYILSGAASMVKNDDDDNNSTSSERTEKKKSIGGEIVGNEDVKWEQKVTGFTMHRFTHPGNHLETTFYDSRSLTAQYTVTSTPQRDSSSKRPNVKNRTTIN